MKVNWQVEHVRTTNKMSVEEPAVKVNWQVEHVRTTQKMSVEEPAVKVNWQVEHVRTTQKMKYIEKTIKERIKCCRIHVLVQNNIRMSVISTIVSEWQTILY